MLAMESGMPAAAVTDTNNLFGVYEIADTLAKFGVQPIVGALLSVELAPAATTQQGSRKKPPHLPLLVQNEAGYRNLTKLLSAAYLQAEPGDWPHVKTQVLSEHSEGLIALTGKLGPGVLALAMVWLVLGFMWRSWTIVNGESLPCVHSRWTQRGEYHDPNAKPGTPKPEFAVSRHIWVSGHAVSG